MKKVLALALAAVMVMALCGVAFAADATITINRHSTWDNPDATSKKATYTPYRIFDVDLSDASHPVYTISGTNAADKVAALPDIFTAQLGADGSYYITLTDSTTSAADIVAALKTMVELPANATLFPAGDAVTSDEDPVTLTVAENGYYLILASNGHNLAVQTVGTALTIDEKNDYPSINKEQKKAADSSYTEAEIPAEIGTYIDYQVTVHIPADANKAIKVFDTMSDGLQYDDTTGLTLAPNIAYTALPDTDAEYDDDATWQIVFSADTVIANQGADIVITYRALITEACLTDGDRENEVKLSYDNGNYVLTDHVDYTTYFGGIEKVDGADHDVKLEGVKFEVTVGDDAFNVTAVTDTDGKVLYYIPGGSSNEVVTGENGKVIIRGLDNTKTYTLTETETNEGYNLLPTSTNLTLAEDTGTAYTTATYTVIENFQGTVLPSTGGIGTTIFYVSGLIMVLGASIILISRRRAESK